MSQVTLLYGASQVLTLRGSNSARRGQALQDIGLIENGSVLIQDGSILAVGPTRRIENLKQARGALTLDVSGSIVMPGLIDPHFHLTFDASGKTGTAKVGRTRRASQVYDNGVLLMRSCLQHGTLAAVLKASAEREDFRSDISLLRLIDKIGTSSVDMVRAWHVSRTPQTQSEFEDFQNSLTTLARRRLVDSISLSAIDALSPDFRTCLSRLLESRLPINCEWSGEQSFPLARVLEQIQPRALACSTTLSSQEIDVLAPSNTIAIFTPGTEMGGRMGGAMREFVDVGGALALASGYHPVAAPGYSMQMAISLAILQGRLSAEEAISASTINAAYVAGLGHMCGTLERGKRADLLVMTVSDYHDIARQFGINHVGTVMREGNIVYSRTRRKIVGDEPRAARMRS